MLTFTKAEEFLSKGRKKSERKLSNNTVLHRTDADTLSVRLHATDVVLIHRNGNYTLNSGGWRTVTTKDRINEYSPVRVYQQKSVWYVTSETQFTDSMVVNTAGKIVSGGAVKAEKKRDKLVASVKKYIDGFAASAVKNKGLKEPSSGDCLYCQMACQNHEHDNPASHVLDHIRERYYVASLLVTAIRHRNPSAASLPIVWSICDREVKEGKTNYLKQVLRAYFRKILPELTPAAVA